MLGEIDLMTGLFILWCAVTGVLIVLAIYRAVVGSREDDQVFLDQAEDHLAREQREIVRKVVKISPYVNTLAIASVLLFLVVAGLWLWRGWTATP